MPRPFFSWPTLSLDRPFRLVESLSQGTPPPTLDLFGKERSVYARDTDAIANDADIFPRLSLEVNCSEDGDGFPDTCAFDRTDGESDLIEEVCKNTQVK